MARLIDIIFDVILVVVVVRMLFSAFRRVFGPAASHSSPADFSSQSENEKRTAGGETVRDPVCGMFVSTELSHQLNWHGKLLHFCSEECLNQYRKSAAS